MVPQQASILNFLKLKNGQHLANLWQDFTGTFLTSWPTGCFLHHPVSVKSIFFGFFLPFLSFPL